MKYPIILLDADDTLLDFSAAEAVAMGDCLARYGLPDSPQTRRIYSSINTAHWQRLERGEITRDELKVSRFRQFLAQLGASGDPAEMNDYYMSRLGSYSIDLPGAGDLCCRLARRHRLYIVTNGSASVQHRRLRKSAVYPYIQKVYLSEVIGAQKPDKAYFDAVFADLGHPDPARVIILGDSQTSDMLGGKNAGITTCWFNPKGKEAIGDWDFTISRLEEFLPIAEEE